jgi:hypothetical protein
MLQDILNAWPRLPEIEAQLRLLLVWDGGGSRVALWLTAFAEFFVLINAVALPFGWLAGKVASWFLPRAPK